MSLALGHAGVFIGLFDERSAPRIHHGSWEGRTLRWTAPWMVPAPPAPGGGREDWTDFAQSVGGLVIAIDRLDPMRIAVNRVEYQGGSHGVVVGRWGDRFDEIASPTDSDIRFGSPLILRGDELWSHDMSAMWHFRRRAGSWSGQSVDLYDRLRASGADELGWFAALSPDGTMLLLDAWISIEVFETDASGAFHWSRSVTPSQPGGGSAAIRGLAWSPLGPAVVLADDAGILIYDQQLRAARAMAFPAELGVREALATDALRFLLKSDDALWVFDLQREAVTHRLEVPPELVARSGGKHIEAAAMHGDRVVVANREQLGVFELGVSQREG